MFTSAHARGVLAEARANLAKKEDRSSSRQPEIIYKTRDNAAVANAPSERGASAASEWAEWVENRIQARLMEFAEDTGKVTGEWLEEIRREQALLRRELATVRDEARVERELRSLRDEVEQARAEIPKLPELAARLEENQTRLQREVESTRKKVSKLRVDQSIADYRLSKLSEATAARSSALELKVETSVASFQMREVHPDARAALRDFAAEALKGTRDEKLWIFDPGPTAGTA